MNENNVALQRGELIPLQQLDGCINTITGKKFNLLNPTFDMVDIIDIAKGLAYKPHFGGLSPQFFSIAEHSMLVKKLAKPETYDKDFLAACLLHDSAEAYIGDMIKPIKVHLPFFCHVENMIMRVIFERFNLDINLLKAVKKYDLRAQEIEYNCFYKHDKYPLNYWNPDKAYSCFLDEVKYYVFSI